MWHSNSSQQHVHSVRTSKLARNSRISNTSLFLWLSGLHIHSTNLLHYGDCWPSLKLSASSFTHFNKQTTIFSFWCFHFTKVFFGILLNFVYFFVCPTNPDTWKKAKLLLKELSLLNHLVNKRFIQSKKKKNSNNPT